MEGSDPLARLESRVAALEARFPVLSPSTPAGEVLEINVGGTIFATFLSTLKKHPSSMLAAMFSGRHPLARDHCGRPFVDRSPKMFALVLEYLRTDIFPAKLLKAAEMPFFESEIDYFGLERPAQIVPVDRLFCKKTIKVESDERMLILCFDVFADHLVIGCRDGSVQVWSKEEGKKTGQLVGHGAGVTDIRIFVNNMGRTIVVSCSTDSTIRLWDLWSHQQVRVIEGNGSFNSIDFLNVPGEEGAPLLAAAGRNCAVFNLNSGMCLQSWLSEVTGSFSCVKSDGGAVYGSTGCQVKEFSLKRGFVQDLVGYSPVKHFVLTAAEILASYADCSIGIWSRASGQQLRSLQGYSSIISRMIVVGNLIFSGSYNGSLLVWNLKTGTLVRHVDSAHAAVIRGIKWLDNGTLISVGADAKIMVWQMHGGNSGAAGEDDPLSPEIAKK